MTTAAYFVPPRFTAVMTGHDVQVTDLRTLSTISLGGELARDFTERPERAAERLSSLAKLDPSLDPLCRALAESRPLPYNRATLLEGSGYDRLFIELTSRCNERCAHCYAESSPERHETLPRQVVLGVIDAAARLGFRSVQLTGGDPLIAPGVLEAAEHATHESFELVEIYTNGLALKGELFERLRALSVAFAFSFYSHRPEAHDAMTRTPGSQERTLDAIRASVAAGLRTRVSIIVNDETAADVEETIALLMTAGLSREVIAVDGVRAVGRGAGSHVAPPQDGRTTRHDGTSGSPSLEFSGTLAVLAGGDVVPCIFQRDVVLGSVLEAPLDAIARSPVPLPPPTTSSVEHEAERATRLGCVECRLRNHLLAPQPLIQLGLRAS